MRSSKFKICDFKILPAGAVAVAVMLAAAVGCSGAGRPDARDSDSPFGVLDFLHWNHDWNKNHYPDDATVGKAAVLMREAGIAFVRMDFLWQDIEPRQGKFDFKKYDRIVGILRKHDIKILGLLNYNTDWSSKAWNSAPNRALFVKYAAAVAKRYKKQVKYWEVWNEPDDKLYWQPQSYMREYTALLKEVYPALKKADPTCRVVLGGIAKFIPQSLKHVYENGGKDCFDIINCHPFQDPRLPSALNQLRGAHIGMRKVMERFGDGDKEMWFTEIGAPGVKTPTKANGWWLGMSPNEEQQAKWLVKIYSNMLKWKGVKKVFWAFFRDLNGFFDSGVNDFGLVRHDLSTKPSYDAYKKFIQDYNTAVAPQK